LAPHHLPLEDSPWQEEDSYYNRLREPSKDLVAFEKFAEENIISRRDGGGKKSSVAPSSSPINGAEDDDGGDVSEKKNNRYVPIEEWDAGRNNGENMTQEERLQWDCQRSGDQFRQNEILRHNLKRF
jgi:hypothetical protein